MKKTNRATEFSKDLCKRLNQHRTFNRKVGIRRWQKNWTPKKGLHESVDAVGLARKGASNVGVPKILIEAELRREDPSSNVVKIWKWIHEGRLAKNIILIQAFSKVYEETKAPRKERARFIGERMELEFRRSRYRQVCFPYRPRARGKVGGGARQKRAFELADHLCERWKEITGYGFSHYVRKYPAACGIGPK